MGTTDDFLHAEIHQILAERQCGEVNDGALARRLVSRLSERWNITPKPGQNIGISDSWFPPSRPRRICEDC